MSEQTKHTPGPWIYDTDGSIWRDFSQDEEEPYSACVGYVSVPLKGDAVINADGYLMAAAPDLLSVCEELEDFCDAVMSFVLGHEDRMSQMQLRNFITNIGRKSSSAIAKTKGETE